MILVRYKYSNNSVMGVMKDDKGGTYYTLENVSTLIPTGKYRVNVCYSPRFNRILPLLSNDEVPASRGVRIHTGNRWSDSRACILAGNTASLSNCTIGESNAAIEQLLINCGDTLEITSIC